MTPLNAVLSVQQIDQIREELERTLRRFERSIKTSGEARVREIDQSAVGRLSRIEALQNQGFTENLQERERSRCEEVLRAIARLDSGQFGVCGTCDAPISFERLMVFPETRTCSSCNSGG
jgi:DnaK suppressor protein